MRTDQAFPGVERRHFTRRHGGDNTDRLAANWQARNAGMRGYRLINKQKDR